ncbi:MAG: universal stress protein [Magnetococcales bacterium]|nr:universal stress protein [Magnetococcales bacterium]MBF0151343.1 universal stress protein [Magnetococcales bacterium]MBF0172976.1 universal stress protein [Magnetococcales bacterium]MBF0348286.1 universal stress protein [Magnetococcales bacterium]MBF0631941.1 universal stress protein [Magnetococcales bacterium]
MESIQFIDLTFSSTFILFLVGFVGGMVSGFIGSGGAFVLTPAMMTMGVPAIVAVASNMAHKFPKALVGAYKRNKYGQVDIKLGVVMGIFAEIGVLIGKNVMVNIRTAFGPTGTNLYVSFVFVIVLAIVGGIVLRDGLKEQQGNADTKDKPPHKLPPLAQWVRRLHIPGTMIHFKSIDAKVSFLVLAPLGMATGMLAATIAVGGFIGVPAMMYFIGLPALMASATELVIAFVMGMGGSILYAMEGAVDIRLSMIILAGSLFGIQIGAIGTTYVKDYVVKFVMAAIMLLVLVSRFFYIPGYLSQLGKIAPIDEGTIRLLNGIGEGTLGFALLFGAVMILQALYRGISEHRREQSAASAAVSATGLLAADARPLSPLGRFGCFLVASDNSDFSAAAVREALGMAQKCKARIHVMSLVASGLEYGGLGNPVLKEELSLAQTHLDGISQQAKDRGIDCETHVIHGQIVDQEILSTAQRFNTDLIVMGRRGRRGLARMMLGHATARVIGKSPCNVLVVPRTAHIEGRHIVLATDGSRHADRAVMTAGQLAHQCQTPITVVSVIDHEATSEQRIRAEQVVGRAVDYLKGQNITCEGTVLTGRPDGEIIDMVNRKNADLIVVGSHGLTGLERILVGSTTERILNGTTTAVFVVKGG